MKKIISFILAALTTLTMLSSCAMRSDLSTDDTLPPDTETEAVKEKDTSSEDKKPSKPQESTPESNLDDSKAPETGENDPADEETNTPETDEPEADEVHVESISLDKYEVTVEIGESDMPWVTMLPEDAPNKLEIWKSSDTSVATVSSYGNITGVSEGECTVTVTSEDNPEVSAEVKVTVRAPKGEVAEATYIDGILIANKTYALPSTYNPGVDSAASSALSEMISAAAAEGINLYQISGFRSYSTQQTLYNNYVARDGQAAADRYSARPGHSEHQTGLAFDLNSLEQSFGETKEGKWLAENCWKYGFIIRYPKSKESVTGYMYEPWHVRYLGKDVAKAVYDSGLCLEEYLGITSVYAD